MTMKTATNTQTLKLYPSGEAIGTIKYDSAHMPNGALGTVRLGSIPHDLYDLDEEYQGTHEDHLVYSD